MCPCGASGTQGNPIQISGSHTEIVSVVSLTAVTKCPSRSTLRLEGIQCVPYPLLSGRHGGTGTRQLVTQHQQLRGKSRHILVLTSPSPLLHSRILPHEIVLRAFRIDLWHQLNLALLSQVCTENCLCTGDVRSCWY